MPTLTERKKSLIQLGQFLADFNRLPTAPPTSSIPLENFEKLNQVITTTHLHNPWFTPETISLALQSWATALQQSSIDKWLDAYIWEDFSPKTVAIITAGNLPLVGFHDLLCVLISGHRALVKQSSKDQYLMPFLVDMLVSFEPKLAGQVIFTSEPLRDFDLVIATGSNNTARYFEYYFKNKPHIIRRNRTSVAVVSGTETIEQLRALGEDIFSYFGMGCRNVSKLYLPKNYDLNHLFNAWYEYHPIINHAKYANNYDYHKAIYLMNGDAFLDNGFFMLKEDTELHAPTAVCFYEFYTQKNHLQSHLNSLKDQLQCVVAEGFMEEETPFGQTQFPALWDYADQIDVLEFLLKK